MIAAQLRPKSTQIKTFLAHVMLEMHNPKLLKKASNYLLYITQKDPHSILAWRLLATAYGRDKALPAAERKAYIAWCLSEVDYLQSKYNDAEKRLSHINNRVKLPYGIAQRIEDLKYQVKRAKKLKKPTMY
jgi:predicted Zn-dependent protease